MTVYNELTLRYFFYINYVLNLIMSYTTKTEWSQVSYHTYFTLIVIQNKGLGVAYIVLRQIKILQSRKHFYDSAVNNNVKSIDLVFYFKA